MAVVTVLATSALGTCAALLTLALGGGIGMAAAVWFGCGVAGLAGAALHAQRQNTATA